VTEFVRLRVGVLAGKNLRPDNDSAHGYRHLREICQVWQVFAAVESVGESEPCQNGWRT
jgi:hypothetical protein